MVISSVAALMEELRSRQLLSEAQLAEIAAVAAAHGDDPKPLASELIQRGWLSAFQINSLLQGRGQELLLGPYLLLELLGEGGMGQVYKARHQKLGRLVALKVIRKERLVNPDAVRRFFREVRAAAQLSHPNIVHAFDADALDGTHFFVMEYIDGLDLSKLVKLYGPLPVERACDYMRQAALGLQHAAECGLVHRDIKPSNLLVECRVPSAECRVEDKAQGDPSFGNRSSAFGNLKILDMGLARMQRPAGHGDESSASLTEEGAVMGTPDYIAPEQVMDSHGVDVRGDLYSLGCTFYFLLTGQPPFPGGTLGEKLVKHQMYMPPPVGEFRPDVPAEVAAVVQKLIAKRPADRYQSPAELAAALAPFARSDTSPTPVVLLKPKSTALPLEATPHSFPSGIPSGSTPANNLLNTTFTVPTALPVEDETAVPQRRRLLLAGGAGVLLVAGLLVFLLLPRRPQEISDADNEPRSGTSELLLKLDPATIPTEERFPWQPPELAAVLGEHRWRHWGSVRTLAVSPDGHISASGGEDKVVRLWDTATGRARATLEGHKDFVAAVAFAPDGQMLASADGQGTVKLWDVATGRELPAVAARAGTSQPNWLAFTPDGKTLCAAFISDRSVSLWDVSSRQERAALTHPVSGTTTFAVTQSIDGKTLAVGTVEKEGDKVSGYIVKLWNVATGKEQATCKGNSEEITCVAFSPDGKTLASASRVTVMPGKITGVIKLWNAASGAELATLKGHTQLIQSLQFSADGKVLSSSAADGSTLLWDVAKKKEQAVLPGLRQFGVHGKTVVCQHADQSVRLVDALTATEQAALHGHSSGLYAVACSADGKVLLTGGADGAVHVDSLTAGQELAVFPTHKNWVYAVAYAPDGKSLVSAGKDGTVKVWDPATAKVRSTFAGHKSQVLCVAFAGNDKLVSGSANETVILWEPSSGKVLHTFKARGVIWSVASAPNGQLIASGSSDGTIKLWDPASGKERTTLRGHRNEVLGVAFSPDGQILASASADKTIRLWDPATGKERTSLQGHAEQVNAVVFSPDGKSLASASNDKTVRLWDVATGLPRSLFKENASDVLAVAFTPNGKTLAAGLADGSVKTWDVATGYACVTLRGHTGKVHGLAFAPDGRSLASASFDQTVKVRDPGTSQEGNRLHGHHGAVQSAAFAGDGRSLVSTGADGLVKLWLPGTRLERATFPIKSVLGAVVAPDGSVVIGTTSLWDLSKFKEVTSPLWNTGELASGIYVSGGPVSAWCDGTRVKLWETASGKEKTSLLLPTAVPAGTAFCLATARSGTAIALGSSVTEAGKPVGIVHLVDVTTRKERILKHGNHVTWLWFTPNGQALVSGGHADGSVTVWDTASGKLLTTLMGTAQVACSPDSKTLVASHAEGTLRLWSAATGKELAVLFSAHKAAASFLEFAPDGQSFISGSSDATILWDAALRKPRAVLKGRTGARLSPDGQTLATTQANATATLWDVATGNEKAVLKGHGTALQQVVFAPDGKTLLTLSADRLMIWDANGSRQRDWLTPGPVRAASYLTDSRHLATANANGTVYILRLGSTP